MNLDNFRQLLIKKTDDSSLGNIINFIKDDVLTDLVLESLEKMAHGKHKGDNANVPIRDFGVEMDPETEPKMLHDALSHHASHYKAALQNGNKDVANQHASQIYRLMDLGDKAQKHSHGKLQVEAVSPHAWERNSKGETFNDRMSGIKKRMDAGEDVSDSEKKWLSDNPVTRGSKKGNQFINDTKGWNHRGKDYSFLQQAPHSAFANEISKHGHNKAYPLEQTKINGKYLDIQDVPADEVKTYKSHPFGKHPIMNHFEKPASSRTPEEDTAWRKQHEEYASSPHMDEFFNKHGAMEQADPEGYAARGSKPSAPVHADVEGLNVGREQQQPQEAQPEQQAGQPKVVTRKAPAKEATPSMSVEDQIKTINNTNMPDHLKASLIRSLKGGNE